MTTYGLSSAEAARRLEQRGPSQPPAGSLTYRAIIRRNVLTLFNFVLAACAVALIATGQLADLLFAAVLVVNSGIGIVQEVRAKRALDRLALLAAPRARVVRDDAERVVAVDDVVVGDAIVVRPGDQVVADGRLLEARGLQVDESILTGESDPDARRAGDELQSGSFCVAGSGIYEAERVGADAYANELTRLAREDRRELSPLQLSINRLLRLMIAIMIPISILLLYALHAHDVPMREAVSTAVAGIVSLVPEGLVLLASLVFAVAAARVGRRGALVQRLPAVEALAGLDVVCLDKTGTLTDGTLAVEEILPLAGRRRARRARAARRVRRQPGRAQPDRGRAARAPPGARARHVPLEVPFSSRWKWSGIAFDDGTELVLGAPEVLVRRGRRPRARARGRAAARSSGCASCCSRARAASPSPRATASRACPSSCRSRSLALSERMRPDAASDRGVPAPRGRRGQDHLGRRPGDRRGGRARRRDRDGRPRDDGRRAARGGLGAAPERARRTPSSRACSPSTSASSWRRCGAAGGAWAWSATASTTSPRSRSAMSRSRSARAASSRRASPTSCS